MTSRTYNFLLAWIILPILVFIGVANYIIDGESTHHLPDGDGMFPRTSKHTGLSKLHYLANKKPEVIYFGSSRVEVGLPPDPTLVGGKSVYNAGISGSSFAETAPLIRHALAISEPKTVVLGIDFVTFTTKATGKDLDSSLLASSRLEYLAKRLPGDLRTALSLDATKQSLQSLDALRNGTNYDREAEPSAVLGQLTDARMRNLTTGRGKAARAFQSKIRMAFRPAPPPAETLAALNLLEELVAATCQHGAAMRIFIHPRHALADNALHEQGEWPRVEEWKSTLGAIATKHQAHCDIRIVDFSGFNSITTESIAGLSATRSLEHYWESSHYKTSVGRLILRRLFAPDAADLPADFGRDLRYDTAAIINTTVAIERETYLRNHSAEVALARVWGKESEQR